MTTLKFKISFFIIILLVVTVTLFAFITVHNMNRQIQNEVIRRAESLSKSIAAVAPYSLLAGDLLGLDNIVSKVREANNDVEYVAITDAHMQILAHTDVTRRGKRLEPAAEDPGKESGKSARIYAFNDGLNGFHIVIPMMFKNRHVGNVAIGINRSVLITAQHETARRIVIGSAVALLLGIGCIIVLSSLLIKPVKELSRGVTALKEGKTSKLRIYASDELGDLTESFNQMSELITRQQTSLSSTAKELEEAYISTVKVLAAAIDARDPYTLGHSTRVARLSVRIGAEMGLSAAELEDLEIASLFHDVGKLKTPDYLLLKDGTLDPLERRQIAHHSEHGAAILSRAPSLHKYIPAVRHHHEWFNGEGYPDKLRGKDIPLHASIIAVADAYDAMTSARPYKDSRSQCEALQELERYAGKQFDPRLVEILQGIVESEPVLEPAVTLD